MEGRPCDDKVKMGPSTSKGERLPKETNLGHLELELLASRL